MVLPVRIIMSPNSSSKCLAGTNARSATLRTISASALPRVAIGGRDNSTPCSPAAPPMNPARAGDPPPGAPRRWYRGAIVRGRLRVLLPGAGGAHGVVRRTRFLRAIVAAFSATALAAVGGGCGGGSPATAGEPSKTFDIEVVRASFPAKQAVAGDAR